MITLQLGQYGNQVGLSFFQGLASELSYTSADWNSWAPFFRRDTQNRAVARAVLVDMEPKVISNSLSQAEASNLWIYDATQSFCKQSGSGNNWAFGYLHHGPSIRDRVLSLVRREAERCDRLSTFLLLQSLAGGTGSGVGTYITEVLRDEYPATLLANQVAWPYGTGDVVVQTYNAAFTLAHLNQLTDAIFVHFNDEINTICTRLLRISQPSFPDLNAVIAGLMGGIMLPSTAIRDSRTMAGPTALSTADSGYLADLLSTVPRASTCAGAATPSGRVATSLGGVTIYVPSKPPPRALSVSSPPDRSKELVAPATLALGPATVLTDTISHMCGHPGFKMLTTKSVPQVPSRSIDYTADTWAALLRPLYHMLRTNATTDERLSSNALPANPSSYTVACRSLCTSLFLRGQQSQPVDAPVFHGVLQQFADRTLYAPWAIDPLRIYLSATKFRRLETFAQVLTNSQAIVEPLDVVLCRARDMFDSRAFLHHYARFGVEEDHFIECFAELEQVLSNYQSLSATS